MVYPRQCPLCAAAYESDGAHTTGASESGGTPSPWRPELPGRLLTLICIDCHGEYVWDYFAGRSMLEAQDLPARQPRRRARRAQQPPSITGSPSIRR